MRKKLQFTLSIFTILTSVAIASSPALAAKPGSNSGGPPASSSVTGNDVSWPQCKGKLPLGQLFGIVGVNNGLANASNPCFGAELSWAEKSTGTEQPKAQLYVNTANPGNLGVADWPKSGSNIFGICTGGDDQQCAYQYGWNMAQSDAQTRIGGNNPASFNWWLDVETDNSWEMGTANDTANNDAALEGMVGYFESANVPASNVGVYSTASQWQQIAGSENAANDPLGLLAGLNDWIPGAGNLSGAQNNCNQSAFTGGRVALTQFVSKQTDYDYSCL